MARAHTLVVGGTRGIGRALVKSLARQKHLLSVIGKNPPARGECEAPGARYWLLDLLRKEPLGRALTEIVEERGKLNNLILCQRYRGGGDSWLGEMRISLSMTRTIVENLCDHFDKSGGGSIVIVSSIASHFIAREQPLSYHVAKAGLNQMVRYYAVLLGCRGIRVNAVSPATVLKEESKEFYSRNEELCELYRKITPLGRMGTSEDVCNVIDFLCSRRGSFITGQDIVVDGGISVQWHETLARNVTSLNGLKVTRSGHRGAL